MAAVQIPLQTENPHYSERVDLDGETYILTFLYTERNDLWTLDIQDKDENDLILGIPIFPQYDLLAQYQGNVSLPQGTLFAINIESEYTEPTYEDFGTNILLIYNEAS